MRKHAITYDAIFAALAVLSVGAGCSKADRASAEPPAAAPAASTPAKEAPAVNATAAPAPPPPPTPQGAASAVVDAGTERAPMAKPKGGSAACGATGCSAEMKKGTK